MPSAAVFRWDASSTKLAGDLLITKTLFAEVQHQSNDFQFLRDRYQVLSLPTEPVGDGPVHFAPLPLVGQGELSPLGDEIPFHFRHAGHDGEEEPADGGAGVHRLTALVDEVERDAGPVLFRDPGQAVHGVPKQAI